MREHGKETLLHYCYQIISKFFLSVRMSQSMAEVEDGKSIINSLGLLLFAVSSYCSFTS